MTLNTSLLEVIYYACNSIRQQWRINHEAMDTHEPPVPNFWAKKIGPAFRLSSNI